MKKRILLLGIILCTLTVNAQRRRAPTFEIIPNIGSATSFFIVNREIPAEIEFMGGAQYGVVGDYYLNDRWSIRSGVSYFSTSELFGSELQMDFLNIPLNANWHFGRTRKWNLNFGVAPGFLLNATNVENEDLKKDLYKSYQVAFYYGIGYKFRIWDNFSLLIDTQAFQGLTNILKDSSEQIQNHVGSSINIGGVISFR